MLTRKQYTALVFVTLFGSFAGGAVMEWLLTGKGARAEEAGKVVRADRFEAREFRVVDNRGKERASLGSFPDGSARLSLLDKDEKRRAALVTFPDGSPFLALADEDGKSRASLAVLPDGTPGLTLFDKDGKTRAGVTVLPGGSSLWLSDKDGKWRASLAMFADGTPALTLSDKDEKTRAVLGCTELRDKRTESVEQRQESSLVLFKSDGDVLWSAP
ncbi:MAG: hypothetical protein COZ06_36945 [Armatimonadetes bacterium CG_4_10_14_3_um_filter_66_18]|nr:MAG: hypothetical protein COS65_14905 [Armatimonadetes bacterium CG06_land_8_20_14_3_00_66_21]PIY36067.1 MAG: hypothetical protein COZ06_36945 [Armatimonadetes bacterium CG_4_10_14_3_um_filter_66_18]PJB65194.1 MAG: hypothetical protein CO096_18885 [Armatimonadetes bacterium CG_4_9_14_3_um_filter_66_14]